MPEYGPGGTAGVSSFNGRSGIVTPGNADYLAVATGGLTGATTATRYVGGTVSGAPVSGTFALGDFVVTQNGHVLICTTAGTPGSWTDAGSVDNMVNSVFGRTGVVTAQTGDYAVAQVTGAAPTASPTFTGITTAPEFSASGLTGAVAASRYVGATTSGHPVTGTFAVGDFTIDQTGSFWVCTTLGTPGTWTNISGGGGSTSPAPNLYLHMACR